MRVSFGLCFENGVKGHELSPLQTQNFLDAFLLYHTCQRDTI